MIFYTVYYTNTKIMKASLGTEGGGRFLSVSPPFPSQTPDAKNACVSVRLCVCVCQPADHINLCICGRKVQVWDILQQASRCSV
jgi:hypothetical protein